MIEPDYFFACPYCGADMSIRLDVTAGRQQQFHYDCETCCSPIQIDVRFDGDQIVHFEAVRQT